MLVMADTRLIVAGVSLNCCDLSTRQAHVDNAENVQFIDTRHSLLPRLWCDFQRPLPCRTGFHSMPA
eukprot:2450355-Amphidinium_carterae.1